jgi:hypothetical protein
MALQLTLQNRLTSYSQLTLVDSTGLYNADTNPTGWGVHNLALTAVVYAHLFVTNPSGIIYDLDIINDLGIDFQTATVDELVYNIPSALIGGSLGDVLADGTYSVVYKISTTDPFGTGYISTYDIMTYYVVQDKVFKRIVNIPFYYKPNQESLYIKETTTLFMLLQALIESAIYYDVTKFGITLNAINDILTFDVENLE